MDSRRSFLKKAALLTGGAGLMGVVPPSIQKALAIDPAPGSTYLDAEHVVFLMQENRSFDHCFGMLQGVRGFNDPRSITLPNQNPVWLQTDDEGETYAPFRLDMKQTKATWMGGLPHAWGDQVDAWNGGQYDQWLTAKRYGPKGQKNLPMTLGYYTREDLPFYYALADAFTVCDQHFCSSLTGTTPNRLYFWTGTIREDENAYARVWNSDTDYDTNAGWTTFPERLEAAGIPWKIYQNEISVGAGLTPEEDSWLANFTDNPLEWFSQYHVKLSEGYIAYLQKAPGMLSAEIAQLEKELKTASGKQADDLQKKLAWKKQTLERITAEQKIYTKERWEQLSAVEKSIHNKAFATNRQDPDYHQLTSFTYKDGDTERELVMPKGDILNQFRKDVEDGKLPAVSWLIAPEKFSDHPSAPWYGAWYVSEVMDILTKNPEVWKKTIFVLTYDENDGYFDHVPPFVVPHPNRKDTGKTSAGIDTKTEYVFKEQQLQHHQPEYARESPIGLGFRVPMVIASPWSRGGWVNSQVFDHTSALQFLENFLTNKYGKSIKETNISAWRRCVCGDLSSVFRTFNGEKITRPEPLQKEAFLESIHKTKFKEAPKDWSPFTATEITQVKQNPLSSSRLPRQEAGVRPSCALPYQLMVEGQLSKDKKTFGITFAAGNEVFGNASAGCPFNVYAPGQNAVQNAIQQKTTNEPVQTRSYAVRAGDKLNDQWLVKDFDKGLYHLQVYGPNGFFREFAGSEKDPEISISLEYERVKGSPQKLTGNMVLLLKLLNSKTSYTIDIEDTTYSRGTRAIVLDKAKPAATVVIELANSFNWYEVAVKVRGHDGFLKRYAGRVENGLHSKTDPFMGRVLPQKSATPL